MKIIKYFIIILSINYHSIAEIQWDQLTPSLSDTYDILIDKKERMYIVGSGWYSGLFISDELGYGWQSKNDGLSNLRLSSLSLNDTVLYAGSFGYGVFRSTNFGENWEPINNGLVTDSTDGSILSLESRGPNIYAGTAGLGILISTNYGESWQPKNKGLPIVYVVMGIGILDSTIFIGGSDGEVSFGIYKSTNNGESWESANNGIDNPARTFIYKIEVHNEILYAATGIGVFISTDRGNNWEYKSNGILDLRIRSIAINDKFLFAGTLNSQIYMSTNQGDSWHLIFDGITNGRIQTLALSKDYLFAGTTNVKSGRWGIFRTRLSDIETSVADIPVNNNKISVYPNPANDFITISIPEINHRVNPMVDKVQIFDMLGLEVLSVGIGLDLSTQKIDVSHLPTGVYFIRIICSNGACSIVEKFVKI